MTKRRVCVLTGTRAEYGLLFWLMKEIYASKDLELQIVVTGMHLSSEFGRTYQQIEEDGFMINKKVEMLLSSDTEVGITKSMGVGMIGFADAFSELNPDLLVVLGDRFEVFVAVSSAMISKIPVAHIHGGELTEGLIDESIRHSITKMSHLHFTATEEYSRRVIQLGEQPNRVFNFGGPGIDNINRLPLLMRDKFEESIDFQLGIKNLLITFHSVTLENSTAEEQFNNLLQVLDEQQDTHLIFTKSNADTHGRIINKMIDNYVSMNSNKATAFTSLGQLRYISAIPLMDGVVGNSSSGIHEVPSFKVPTINIGDRQRGRIQANSVIDCNPSVKSIRSAFATMYSETFQKKLIGVVNPYGEGGSSEKICNTISTFPLDGILKKSFYNLDYK